MNSSLYINLDSWLEHILFHDWIMYYKAIKNFSGIKGSFGVSIKLFRHNNLSIKKRGCEKLIWPYSIEIFSGRSRRGGRSTTTVSCPSHILLIFFCEPLQNPCPFKIIFLKCLILPDKTIFKELGQVRA